MKECFFQMSDSDEKNDEHVILHVAVLGFHHKKGTVLEYSYPPLSEGNFFVNFHREVWFAKTGIQL